MFISQNFHTRTPKTKKTKKKKKPSNWSNSSCKIQKKREGGREGWVWGIQSVGPQLLGLVCGAVKGLRTKVLV